jgi:hypothetical protein
VSERRAPSSLPAEGSPQAAVRLGENETEARWPLSPWVAGGCYGAATASATTVPTKGGRWSDPVWKTALADSSHLLPPRFIVSDRAALRSVKAPTVCDTRCWRQRATANLGDAEPRAEVFVFGRTSQVAGLPGSKANNTSKLGASPERGGIGVFLCDALNWRTNRIRLTWHRLESMLALVIVPKRGVHVGVVPPRHDRRLPPRKSNYRIRL